MYFSIFPSKDSTITNLNIRGVSKTGSNMGQSEIAEIYNLTESLERTGKSRMILYFDLASLSQSTVDGDIPTSSVQYRLVLKDAAHIQPYPYSYDLKILPLSRAFDEGRGLSMEDEDLKDAGVVNWTQATSVINWTLAGGDFVSSSLLTQSAHFDFGTEDLNIDISNIVYAWLTGGMSNHGLMIKLDDFYETGSSDKYTKKFFTRHALVPERKPRLEALWTTVLQNDRSSLPYNFTSSLSYYRFIDGLPNDIQGNLFVNILNSSSTVVQTLTASKYESGVYQISGVYIQPTSSTQIFRDIWFAGTQQFFTGTVSPVLATGSTGLNFDILSVDIVNLKSFYYPDEKPIIRVFIKEKDYKTAVVRQGFLDPNPILAKDCYYQIENANNNEVIVPFSSGSIKYSKLSYDTEGNYFKLWTSSFAVNSLYRIKILVNFNNKRFIYDKDWMFSIQNQ